MSFLPVTSVTATGEIAHDAVDSGAPLKYGGKASSALPTAVADGDRVNAYFDLYGRQVVHLGTTLDRANDSIGAVSPALSHNASNGTPITASGDTILVAAPTAGNHRRIHRIHFENTGSTRVTICIKDGAAGAKLYETSLGQYEILSTDLRGGLKLTSATALYLNISAAGGSINYTVSYETLAD